MSEILYIDFNNRRYSPPFQCFCCGIIISPEQFAFSRICAICDVGVCNHPNIHVLVQSEPIPAECNDIQILMKKIGYDK